MTGGQRIVTRAGGSLAQPWGETGPGCGGYRIDRGPVPPELVGADTGQHGHGGFGGAVGGFGAETVQAGSGGSEHHRGLDAAACLRFGAPVTADDP
jgi:hypothetical protein